MPVFASTSAPGGGSGTLGSPYTLKEAADNVNGQDTIFCRGGQYTGITGVGGAAAETFGNIPSGSGANYTTIEPYEDEVVEFIAAQNTGILFRMPVDMTRVRFQHIIFTGNFTGGLTSTSQQACITGHNGDSASHLDILDCVIQEFPYVTIQTSSTPNIRILRSIFQNLFGNPAGAYGVYVNGGSSDCEIGWCTFRNISEQNIQHFSSSSESSNCRYHDNIFTEWANGHGGSTPAMFITNGTGNWVWNNLFYGGGPNSLGAIHVEFGGGLATALRSSIFAHNAIYNPGGYAFRFGQAASSPNTILNNIAHGATINVSSDGDQTPTQTTNLWQVAPTATAAQTWVNPGVDFHLLGTSAAINAGTLNANFPLGHDGTTRGDPPDIGPYEFGAAFAPDLVIPSVRTTMINIPLAFTDADVIHGGDLVRGVVYVENGSLA